MEGLSITPDGRMLVGIMQANLKQDAVGSQRIVTIDIQSGTTHEYAYQLTDGSGVGDIVAVNDHQFLVDERDGKGMGDQIGLTDSASAAKVKKLYVIDLNGAAEITNVAKLDLGSASNTVVPVQKTKTPFLDVVAKLTAAGMSVHLIPSKVEGVTFGPDVIVHVAGQTLIKHTLYIGNDNDYLSAVADPLAPACVAEAHVRAPSFRTRTRSLSSPSTTAISQATCPSRSSRGPSSNAGWETKRLGRGEGAFDRATSMRSDMPYGPSGPYVTTGFT